MNFNADDNIAEGGGREGREVTAGDPCQRARNRNATRRVDGALPRERDVGISGRNYTGGDLKARATRIAARAPNKYIYIYSEKERERERFIVGYGSSAEPGQQIFGVSLFLRENAARRDVTEITKRALPLLALLSIPNPLLATRLVPVFNEISNVAKLFPLRIRIYIYIFFHAEGGGWRFRVYLLLYDGRGAYSYVRTYDGMDIWDTRVVSRRRRNIY